MEKLVVHSATATSLLGSIPGHVEEPEEVAFRLLHYSIREYVSRRCRHGDFPLTFEVNLYGQEGTTVQALLGEASFNSWRIPPPPPFRLLDFREITRKSDRIRCKVTVEFGHIYGEHAWIRAGSVSLDQNDRGVATLKGYLPEGVTDFEHDSSYAFNFDLIGLRFKHTWYGTSWFEGYLHPDIERFHVPNGNYNPMEDPKAWTCDQCDKPHRMLPDGFFLPKTSEENKKLFAWLQGKLLSIRIGPKT